MRTAISVHPLSRWSRSCACRHRSIGLPRGPSTLPVLQAVSLSASVSRKASNSGRKLHECEIAVVEDQIVVESPPAPDLLPVSGRWRLKATRRSRRARSVGGRFPRKARCGERAPDVPSTAAAGHRSSADSPRAFRRGRKCPARSLRAVFTRRPGRAQAACPVGRRRQQVPVGESVAGWPDLGCWQRTLAWAGIAGRRARCGRRAKKGVNTLKAPRSEC